MSSGRLLACVLALSLLLACGDDDSGLSDPVEPPPDEPPDLVTMVIKTGLWEAPDGEGRVPEIPETVDAVVVGVETDEGTHEASVAVGATDQVVRVEIGVPDARMCRVACRALDDQGAEVYRGVAYVQRDGAPDSVTIHLADAADSTPPEAPDSVTATAVSASEIELDWPPVVGDDAGASDVRYLIWVDPIGPRAKGNGLPWVVSGPGTTNALVGGLEADQRWHVTLRSVDAAGNESLQSAVANVATMAASIGRYVDAGAGVDGDDCGDPDSPCRSITRALALSDDDEPIYVAAGTYDADHGEIFPLVLRDGTRLVGTVAWPRGTPTSVIVADAPMEAVIEVPVDGAVVGLWIDAASGGPARIIDAREGDVRVDMIHIEASNQQSAIHAGREARIRNTIVEGAVASGIAVFGDGAKLISGCIVRDGGQGISVHGHDTIVIGCLVEDCLVGFLGWGSEPGTTGDLHFARNVALNCNDGFDLQRVADTRVTNCLAWRNSQQGIHLMDTDSTTMIVDCHVDGGDLGSNAGIYVRRGNPVIDHCTLVCSRVNLYVEGTGLVHAEHNRWDNAPPMVTVRPDDEACVDSDICYDGEYSGTPEPMWSPWFARTSCLVIAIVPPPTVADLADVLDRVQAATARAPAGAWR